ncbi:hypothetical protein ACI1TH_00480 [Lactococcus petauri]
MIAFATLVILVINTNNKK